MSNRVTNLTEGVHRIRIDSECGLVVNVFVLETGAGVALVDTGLPHTLAQLEEGLARLGYGLGDVSDVFYTHTHIDHLGGGGAAFGRWSPREWLWEGSLPSVVDAFDHIERWRTPESWPCGIIPDGDARDPLVVEIMGKPRTPVRTAPVGRLGDPRGVPFGGSVSVGPWVLECVDARGHDPLHCAWYVRSRGWLFSGDVILATPVPLVTSMGDSVGLWLGTLERWQRDLEVSWLLPGHGMPTRLFEPSMARSRGWLERVYDALAARLNEAESAGALEVTRLVLPRDASRFAARSAVVLATVDTLYRELEERGVVREVELGRWEAVGTLPDLGALSTPSESSPERRF